MSYIICNDDGSVKKTNFTDIINQNNDGVNQIFVSIQDISLSSYDLVGLFVLPDGSTSVEVGVPTTDYEYIEGIYADGWLLTLTQAETFIPGVVRLTLQVQAKNTQTVLYTYRVPLTVNETAAIDSITNITIAQFNNLKNYVDTNFQKTGESGGYVPYVGADKNLNLGDHELIAKKVNVGGLTIEQLSASGYQIGANYQDTLDLDFDEVYVDGVKVVVEDDLADYVTSDTLINNCVPYQGADKDVNIEGNDFYADDIYSQGDIVATQLWVGNQGYLTEHQSLDGLVPYNGANANVDLGEWNLYADQIVAEHGLTSNDDIVIGSQPGLGGYKLLISTAMGDDYPSFEIRQNNVSLGFLNFPTIGTGNSYTIATDNDLANYVPYTGATSDLNLGTSSIVFSNGITLEVDSAGASNNFWITHGDGGIILDSLDGVFLNTKTNANLVVKKSDLGDYIPYTGATSTLNLGSNELVFEDNQSQEGRIGLNNGSLYLVTGTGDIILNPDGGLYYGSKNSQNEIATKGDLPQKNAIGTFNTSSFTNTGSNYVLTNIPLSGFINGSDLLIITWGGCFAICPIPASGPGRVAAALWNNNGESQVVRIKYELKSNNTLLDISLAGGFTPPSNFTGYVINYKIA